MFQDLYEMLQDFWQDIGKKALKLWWCCVLTISLGASLFDGTLQKNLMVIENINWWIIMQNFIVIIIVIVSFVGLIILHPIFKWSWLSLFKSDGTNINIIPMRIKYFGLLFALLLMANLPSLAMTEEKMFRLGTIGWIEGLNMSFLFGMMHCLVGVPIGAGLAIMIAGLWFTHQYFIGGIELSALHHTTYNLILVSVIFLFLILGHMKVIELNEKIE